MQLSKFSLPVPATDATSDIYIFTHKQLHSHTHIYIYIFIFLFLATRTKYLRNTALRLVPLVFFSVMVVVTTCVGGVFRVSSNFLTLSEMEKSCVECLWRDPRM